jgi:predicted kinase
LDGAEITPAQWDVTYAEVYRRIETALLTGERTVYDETCFSRAQRDIVRAIAARAAASAQLIWVTTPIASAHARLLANRQSGLRHNVSDENFALVVTRFEAPTPDEKPLRYDGTIPVEEWLATVDLWA